MAGSIRNNNSAHGGNNAISSLNIDTYTVGLWLMFFADSYENLPVYQYVFKAVCWAYGQEVGINSDANSLFFTDSGDTVIATGGSTSWYYLTWKKVGLNIVVKYRPVESQSWNTLVIYDVDFDADLEYVSVFESGFPFAVSPYNAAVRSVRMWNIERDDTEMLEESNSRVPVNETNKVLSAADGNNPDPTEPNWNDPAISSTIILTTGGTAVYYPDDPITDEEAPVPSMFFGMCA